MRTQLKSIIATATGLLVLWSVNVPVFAADIDSLSSVREAGDDSLQDLVLGGDLGNLTFILNGGFLLLFGALACFLVAMSRRDRAQDQRRPLKLYARHF
jgi:hypothetical protein